MRALLILILLGVAHLAAGQSGKGPKYFPRGNKVLPAGVAYPAQLFPEKDWERDMAKIAQLGFSFVRLGDEAWPRLEPSEGNYDLAWLDRCIDLAARNKLKVVLSTAIDAVPRWLVRLHSDAQAPNIEGKPYPYGSIDLSNLSYTAYQKAAEGLVSALGRRYGQNGAVVGWIVEVSQVTGSASAVRQGFQTYMKQITGDNLDTLNVRWGTLYTPRHYFAWEEITIPGIEHGDGRQAYSAADYDRYRALRAAEFANAHISLLRRLTLGQFVSPVLAFDPFLLRNQDFVSFESFNPGSILTGLHGIALGPNGHTGWNVSRLYRRDSIKAQLIAWQLYGLGTDYVCFGRYRDYLTNDAIVDNTGTYLTPAGRAVIETLSLIERLKGNRSLEAIEPDMFSRLRTGILLGSDRNNVHESTSHISYPIHRSGSPVHFLEPGIVPDPSKIPFVIAALHEHSTPALLAHWRQYVAAGGHLILCPYGRKERVRAEGLIYPIASLTGAYPNPTLVDGQSESLVIAPGMQDSVVLMSPDVLMNQDYLRTRSRYEKAADSAHRSIARRQIGRGALIYTLHSTYGGGAADVMYKEAGVARMELPSSVSAHWHEGLLVITNYSSEPFKAAFPSAERIVGEGTDIGPNDVGVFKMYK